MLRVDEHVVLIGVRENCVVAAARGSFVDIPCFLELPAVCPMDGPTLTGPRERGTDGDGDGDACDRCVNDPSNSCI